MPAKAGFQTYQNRSLKVPQCINYNYRGATDILSWRGFPYLVHLPRFLRCFQSTLDRVLDRSVEASKFLFIMLQQKWMTALCCTM
eukprot:6306156-Amphidinium_carterae.1